MSVIYENETLRIIYTPDEVSFNDALKHLLKTKQKIHSVYYRLNYNINDNKTNFFYISECKKNTSFDFILFQAYQQLVKYKIHNQITAISETSKSFIFDGSIYSLCVIPI